MKFIVNELPYYEEFCPFYMVCSDNASESKCPRHWDKEKVCSDSNPHECLIFVEANEYTAKSDHNESEEDRCCRTCIHFKDSNMESSCAICFGYSNWEAK